MRALADLRARGFDLVVVDVSPLPFVDAAGRRSRTRSRSGSGRSGASRCATGYERLGVPVVEWTEGEPLAQAIEEVSAFRRSARRASA